jgi:hypothetical protein
VLEVISRAGFDLQAVFETVVDSSARLCGAERCNVLSGRRRADADGCELQRL